MVKPWIPGPRATDQSAKSTEREVCVPLLVPRSMHMPVACPASGISLVHPPFVITALQSYSRQGTTIITWHCSTLEKFIYLNPLQWRGVAAGLVILCCQSTVQSVNQHSSPWPVQFAPGMDIALTYFLQRSALAWKLSSKLHCLQHADMVIPLVLVTHGDQCSLL